MMTSAIPTQETCASSTNSNMKISRNWLQTFFDKPLPKAGELAELFTFHSFEVEGIESFGDDGILDVKVLPDRAHYCLSHAGVALEVSVLTGQPLKQNRIPPPPAPSLEMRPEVDIEATDFCRRYMARYAEIGEVRPSDPHAKAMLESIGERAINLVVDATNITMFDMGQPLHAFDADEVKGAIVVRAARKDEKILLLDSSKGPGVEVSLLATDHVIADDAGPIAIAGVKGGKRAGVSSKTRRLIIESASFDPTAVRRTAARLGLRSESSKRYENEITPEMTAPGMDSVCALIAYNIPAARFGPLVDVYPKKAVHTVIEFDPAALENRLGIKVPLDEARRILECLRVQIKEKSGLWHLTIPFERLDLTITEDIIEEIGRIYGYEHVAGVLPPKPDKQIEMLPSFYLSEKIKNLLVDQGFSEVSLYTLVARGEVETAQPLARDKAFARTNLTDGMMACLQKNSLNADLLGLDAVKALEIGHVFEKSGERAMLAIGVAQIKKAKGVKSRQVLDEAVKSLAVLGQDLAQNAKVIEKGIYAVAEIDLTGFLKSYALPADASYEDLNSSSISNNKFTRFSQYPFIVRDIAVFAPETASSEAVWQAVEEGIDMAGARDILARHSLFDTFKKDGRVSHAYRMVFQSMDRTLTDDEVKKVMDSIYSVMAAKSWEVR